jgi:hypothetical protein
MSDETIYGEDDRDFHSPFDLGFDPPALETIKWLILGHILFLVGLAVVLYTRIDNGNIWITPLFGLPLIWATRRHRNWGLILVFVVGFTAAHYLAAELARGSYRPGAEMTPGLIGGAVGAAGALILCAISRLLRADTATFVFAAFGVAILAAVGSFGVYMYLTAGPAAHFGETFVRMLWVYTPWQFAFAYVLAKSLKPIAP